MRRIDKRWGFAIVALAVAGCAALACSSSDDDGKVVPVTGDASRPLPGPTGAAGTGENTGLPCEVQAVLENRCLACHSGTSPPPLLDYDDLVAPSVRDPSKTRARLALERMQNGEMPPPPAEAPELDEIQTFEVWVNAGSPRGPVCTDPPPPGGSVDTSDGGADAGICTSGVMWTLGNTASGLMHPGQACNACHQVLGGPNLRAAGTVYPTLQEKNDCNGAKPPLSVVITDAQNRVFTLPVNEAGNFYTRQKIKVPYRARVTDGVKERQMMGSVTSGDCNGCHTTLGANGAPGRIMAP